MTTVWDRAVRTVAPLIAYIDGEYAPPDGERGSRYYCGGEGAVPFCKHAACAVVTALADADILDYAPLLGVIRDEPQVATVRQDTGRSDGGGELADSGERGDGESA